MAFPIMTVRRKIMLLEFLDIFKALGIAILLVFAIITLHTQNRILQTTSAQVDATKSVVDQIKASGSVRAAQLQQLSNHIDCIVELFQQPDHNNLSISDLQNCQLNKDGSENTNSSAPAQNTSSNPTQSSSKKNSPSGAGATPHRPFLCTITLKLIGCN